MRENTAIWEICGKEISKTNIASIGEVARRGWAWPEEGRKLWRGEEEISPRPRDRSSASLNGESGRTRDVGRRRRTWQDTWGAAMDVSESGAVSALCVRVEQSPQYEFLQSWSSDSTDKSFSCLLAVFAVYRVSARFIVYRKYVFIETLCLSNRSKCNVLMCSDCSTDFVYSLSFFLFTVNKMFYILFIKLN